MHLPTRSLTLTATVLCALSVPSSSALPTDGRVPVPAAVEHALSSVDHAGSVLAEKFSEAKEAAMKTDFKAMGPEISKDHSPESMTYVDKRYDPNSGLPPRIGPDRRLLPDLDPPTLCACGEYSHLLANGRHCKPNPCSTHNKRELALTNLDVAQFALTLEHLENAFYKQAVSKWSTDVFVNAGFSAFFYDQLKYITHEEEGHVQALEAIITAAGGNPVQACSYDFPMTTPREFVKLASIVEGLGVSAYLGAAPALTDKYYLTAAASILVTESLHQAAERNAVGEIPMANVFGTPLPPNAVYTIASGFIKSCPASNAPLPFKAYTSLKLNSGLPTASILPPNQPEIDVVPSAPINHSGNVYGTFVSGLDTISVGISRVDGEQYSFQVPDGIPGGQSYFFLTSDKLSGSVNDSNILAGPSIIEITPNAPTFDLSIL